MAERIDVLAAMDLADAWLIEEGYNLKSRRTLKEARAAVAELIAANTERLAAIQACVDANQSGISEAMSAAGGRAHDAEKRLRAAIARIGSKP